MTTPTQPKSTPVPAILVYGTPSGPALTQASWFRAERTKTARAAAAALKFSVIRIAHPDTDRGLAAGAHEASSRAAAGWSWDSVSAEVYRRIEEHVRKGARYPDPSQPENAAATASEQNTNIGAAISLDPHPRAWLRRRSTSRTARRLGDPSGRREGAGRLLEREARVRGIWLATVKRIDTASSRSSGSTARNIRRSRAGPRTSPFPIPSSASRANDARIGVRANSMGRPSGRPSSFRACPEPGARHPPPKLKGKAMTSRTVTSPPNASAPSTTPSAAPSSAAPS